MDNNEVQFHPDRETPSITQTKLVLVEICCDGTAVIILNRPQKRNALSAALIADLNAALRALERNESVRVIVLTGPAGGPFSGRCTRPFETGSEVTEYSAAATAGADLGELRHMSTCEAHRSQYLRDLSDGIAKVRKPIVVSIEGFAVCLT